MRLLWVQHLCHDELAVQRPDQVQLHHIVLIQPLLGGSGVQGEDLRHWSGANVPSEGFEVEWQLGQHLGGRSVLKKLGDGLELAQG